MQRVEAAVGRVARVALRHDDEGGIELVAHVDRGAIARDGLLERHDLHARRLRAALAFDRLVVDAHAGEPGVDALAHQAPHRHDAAVAGVAVEDDRELDRCGDPFADLHALGHRRRADVGEAGVAADHRRWCRRSRPRSRPAP